MRINLQRLYPYVYNEDIFVEVSITVWEEIQLSQLRESAYKRQMYRYSAQYSLDCEDGIERELLELPLSPEDTVEREYMQIQVKNAIQKLPPIQARRIYARFYMEQSVVEIAQVEGVDRRQVWSSIQRGVKNLRILLKESF